jgi:hypothetical protein
VEPAKRTFLKLVTKVTYRNNACELPKSGVLG